MPLQNEQVGAVEASKSKQFRARYMLIFGAVAFLISFIVICWNESRSNMLALAKRARVVSSNDAAAGMGTGMVVMSGQIVSDEKVGDTFNVADSEVVVRPNNWIVLNRKVEVFGWKSNENKSVDDSAWLSDSSLSENTNQFLHIKNNTFSVANGQLGTYSLDVKKIQFPSTELQQLVFLNDEDVVLPARPDTVFELVGNHYIFVGAGTFTNPKIGDIRISYVGVPNQILCTLFGAVDDGKLVPFATPKKPDFYRLFFAANKDEALEQLSSEQAPFFLFFRMFGGGVMVCSLLVIILFSKKK
jgi:hypothetical protein